MWKSQAPSHFRVKLEIALWLTSGEWGYLLVSGSRLTDRKTRSTTAVENQHLKIKEWDISLTKIITSLLAFRKISSIHKIILKMQQILGSQELKRLWPFLTMSTQKSLNQPFAFLNLYQHGKNMFIPSVHFLDTVNLRAPSPDWPHSFFTMPTPKVSNYFFICMNLYQHAKNQVIPSVHSWDTVNFHSRDQIGHIHILTMPKQKLFEQL